MNGAPKGTSLELFWTISRHPCCGLSSAPCRIETTNLMGALEEVAPLHHTNPSGVTRTVNDLTTRELRATRRIRFEGEFMANDKRNGKQNVTISLDRKTIQKAKVFAARRSTSISGLLARQIEVLVGEEEAYERAERQAMTLLDQGFHLGGVIRVGRDELHER